PTDVKAGEGFVGNGLPEKDVFYFHPDHLGSSSYISTLNGQISQHVEYIAFGEVLFEEHSSSFSSPYLFNGKELDRETNLTNFGARYLDMKTSLWLNVDPLAEKYPSWSPYSFCFDNPMKFVDPTGMEGESVNSPIYNTSGTLLGTDDKGLQGKAIVMDEKNFKQNMSHDEALKNNLGAEGLKDNTAKSNLVSSFNSLPSRPDYDGKVTLSEANDWFKNGNGQPLFVNLGKIDMTGISSSRFDGIKDREVFNLLYNSNDLDDVRVIGSFTLRLYPNNQVKAFQDTYNFEQHSWKNPLEWPRNILTVVGSALAGEGTTFPINFYGTQTIKPIYMPNK
ncbi:RHS repeat domain-containing protein, partial [Flavobacterium psychrophilum]|uniref:RHS repeat domain-containing protein n=1 Tax=Flavobacterium psychrophilum TaxID=96345 RepID=UPI00117ADE1B